MHYTAYCDESSPTVGQFRSICAFSAPAAVVPDVRSSLNKLLSESGIREFKWNKLKDAKYRFGAEKIINYLLSTIGPLNLRLDTLVWDTHDERHDVPGRCDRKNFERMFFHLLRNSMTRRERQADWSIFPDERLEIDWNTIRDCLSHAGNWREYFEHPLLQSEFSEHFFNIIEFEQTNSDTELGTQVADLFAGMAAFSRAQATTFAQWRSSSSDQAHLFEATPSPSLSKRLGERFQLIDRFDVCCKARKHGVSLRTYGYLVTMDPSHPINFWHYVPQHHADRAPTRDG